MEIAEFMVRWRLEILWLDGDWRFYGCMGIGEFMVI